MRILVFGASGMVGHGVLLECLDARDVECVRTIGRTTARVRHAKLDDVVVEDLADPRAYAAQLAPFDACFFCVGTGWFGTTGHTYTKINYDLVVAIAEALVRVNPRMTFVYVSGRGTDMAGRFAPMWTRVKARTENTLQRLAFKAVYLFRPSVVQPVRGARSRTSLHRVSYGLLRPVLALSRVVRAGSVLTTADLGRAMLDVTRHGVAGRGDRVTLDAIALRRISRAAKAA